MKQEYSAEILNTEELKTLEDIDSNILKLESLKNQIDADIIKANFYKLAMIRAINKQLDESREGKDDGLFAKLKNILTRSK